VNEGAGPEVATTSFTRLRAMSASAPERCSLIHHGWTGTRKGVGAEPGAVGSPLVMLALRGPIGVKRDPAVWRWDWQ
jgi:hypothetical protein